jgi:pyruvate kinase
MLSGESAAGDYPEEAVQMMVKIASSTEPIIPHRERLEKAIRMRQRTITDAICISVVECTLNLDNVSAIIAFTETGGTARRISKYRPNVPIIACTENDDVLKSLTYYNGVIPVLVERVRNIAKYDDVALEIARRQGLPKGSKIIITSGMGGTIGGTNTIRVIEVL